MVDQVSLLNYITQKAKLSKREQEVYDALLELGEATSWEIMDYLKIGFNPNFVRPRLTDLMKKHELPMVEKVRQVQVDGIKQWKWRAL